MVISLFLSLALILFFFNILFSTLFLSPSRYSVFTHVISSILKSLNSGIYSYFFSTICLFFLLINFTGNIPGFSIPSLFYFYTASISVAIWLALILVVYQTQLSSFMAHILPFGAPAALSLFLPLIEIFSHLIRPFTLMVRISTNLSSGHIILFMFSFFSLSRFGLTLIISVVLSLLLLLELIISVLQAYIFSSLSLLYISETL